MIDMNDRLMVDRDCFERGCMSIPHTHVRAIKDYEVVWMVKDKPELTNVRWKEWRGLTKENADSIECWFREEIENDRFSVENLIVRIEAMLKELNT